MTETPFAKTKEKANASHAIYPHPGVEINKNQSAREDLETHIKPDFTST
jgi:hypothetical protein